MSIYRKLLLALLLSSIVALVGSVVTTTMNVRSYYVDQLRLKNQDNASSLALSLSQSGLDPVSAELMVAAQFDSGNYDLVRFTDAKGHVAVEKKSTEAVMGVPQWFMQLVPIEVAPGVAKVTNGWRQLGTVSLISHSHFAYQALWKSVLRTTLIMLVTTLVGCALGLMILHRVRKSLDQVVHQARLVTQKRFVTMEEPDEPELKQVTSAMNSIVDRLREMFEEEAARLDLLRRAINEHLMCLLPFAVTDFEGKVLHMEGPLRFRPSADSPWLSASQFFPVAEQMGVTAHLDLTAITLGINAIAADDQHPGFGINVSTNSLLSISFISHLKELIRANSQTASRLWLEFPESGVFKDLELFRNFCHEMHGTGISIGIEHFGGQLAEIEQLQNIGIQFLKVDATFTYRSEGDPAKQAILSEMVNAAHRLGLQVYAEGVVSDEAMVCLKGLGFDGATGPAVSHKS